MKRKGTAQYYDKSQIINNTLQNINRRYGNVSESESMKLNTKTDN